MSNSLRTVRLLQWFSFCLDFRFYGAVTAIYFAQVTGSYTLGLSIFSIGTLATALFEIPTGVLSDFWGRKATLVAGQIAGVSSVIAYAIGGDYWVLAVGAVLGGLASALFSGNNSALLYETLKDESKEGDFAHHDGRISAMFQIALALSALIGAVVLTYWPLSALFWLSVIPQVFGLVFALLIKAPVRREHGHRGNVFAHMGKAVQNFWYNARLRAISVAKIIDSGVGESSHQLFPILSAMLWPLWAVSAATFVASACAAAGFWVAGTLMKRYGERTMLVWSGAANLIVKSSVIAVPTIVTPLVNALTSFTFATGIVGQNAVIQRELSDSERATMGSLTSFAGSAVFAVSALVLGYIADVFGVVPALLLAQLCMVIVLVTYMRLPARTT